MHNDIVHPAHPLIIWIFGIRYLHVTTRCNFDSPWHASRMLQSDKDTYKYSVLRICYHNVTGDIHFCAAGSQSQGQTHAADMLTNGHAALHCRSQTLGTREMS